MGRGDTGKKYKHHTLRLLDHDRQLSHLEKHMNNKTTPEGLVPKVNSTLPLSEAHKQKWNQVLVEAGRKLRNITMDHHRDQIKIHDEERTKLKTNLEDENLKQLDDEIQQEYHTREQRKRKSNDNNNNNQTKSKNGL